MPFFAWRSLKQTRQHVFIMLVGKTVSNAKLWINVLRSFIAVLCLCMRPLQLASCADARWPCPVRAGELAAQQSFDGFPKPWFCLLSMFTLCRISYSYPPSSPERERARSIQYLPHLRPTSCWEIAQILSPLLHNLSLAILTLSDSHVDCRYNSYQLMLASWQLRSPVVQCHWISAPAAEAHTFLFDV